MYFDDLKIGMAVGIAPALIKKEKMLAFARDYDNIPCIPTKNMPKVRPLAN